MILRGQRYCVDEEVAMVTVERDEEIPAKWALALWPTALTTEAAQTLPSRPNNDQLEDVTLSGDQ